MMTKEEIIELIKKREKEAAEAIDLWQRKLMTANKDKKGYSRMITIKTTEFVAYNNLLREIEENESNR